MSDLARINNYAQQLIDETTKNTTEPLDFLEGFVYALLMIQQRVKLLSIGKEE